MISRLPRWAALPIWSAAILAQNPVLPADSLGAFRLLCSGGEGSRTAVEGQAFRLERGAEGLEVALE